MAGVGAHGMGDGFEEALGGWGVGQRDLHLAEHAGGDARGDFSATVEVEIEGTGEEGVDDVEVVVVEAGDCVGWEQGGVLLDRMYGWFFVGLRVGRKRRGEGAAAVGEDRLVA